MMQENKTRRVDLGLLLSYLLLIVFGWLNIYSAVYSEEHGFILDMSQRYGQQFIWIGLSILTAIFILYIIRPEIYSTLSPILYIIMAVMLFAVIFVGKEVNGSKSWFFIGSFGLQPAEFSKITTSLLLSYIMSQYGFTLTNRKMAATAAAVVLLPIMLIIMEKETGSALVYLGLLFVFYMQGMSGWFIVLGFSLAAIFSLTISFSPLTAIVCALAACSLLRLLIWKRGKWFISAVAVIVLIAYLPKLYATLPFLELFKPEVWALILFIPHTILWIVDIYKMREDRGSFYLILSLICAIAITLSINIIFNKVLQPHQRARIENLFGITEDLQGIGYNVHQSKIAIGSGGLTGKGFLNGTQTKYNFVPEQSTDFIFCTVGEEWGFVGSLLLLIVYIYLIVRIIVLASKNFDTFTKLYGYCVASIFLMHVVINMGMTMGLLPVIGIPLPFLSYGGSSMLSFTILLFIFIRLDMERQSKE